MKNTIFWRVLGGLCVLAAASLLMQAPNVYPTLPPEKHQLFILGTALLVGLCGLFAIACWFPESHRITLRLIGVIGVASCLYSIFDAFRDQNLPWFAVVSRLGLIFAFWLPGSVYLVIKGKMTDF